MATMTPAIWSSSWSTVRAAIWVGLFDEGRRRVSGEELGVAERRNEEIAVRSYAPNGSLLET